MRPGIWLRMTDGAVRAAVGVVAILVALMMIHLMLDSAGRNLFNAPVPGTTDVVTNLWMPGLAILALGHAQLRDEQVRVTILTEKTSPRARRVLEVAAEVVGGLTVLLLTVLTAQVFLASLEVGKRATSSRWLPIWPGQLLVVIGFAICTLAAVARVYRLARGEEIPVATAEREGSTVD